MIRPKKCGACGSNALGPIGKNWTWCIACGAVGNGSHPGDWIAPDPNVKVVPASPELLRIAAFPPLRAVPPPSSTPRSDGEP